MAEIRRETQHHSGLNLSGILFALFKRKLTILLCAAVSIIAAAAFYFFFPPVYESQAKLLVRYVLERSAVDSIDSTNVAPAAALSSNDRVIGAEIEILTSWDLAVQVAQAIGPKRLHAATEGDAAGAISSGLKAISNKGSNIIFVSYRNSDPQIATLVLQELLSRYFVKHLEVHRSAGAFDFVTQQTDQVRARLNQTADALKSLRDKTGIVSLKDGSEALTAEAAKTQDQLNTAEADLAQYKAVVKQTGESKSKKWKAKSSTSEKTPQSEKAQVAGIEAKVETLKARLRNVQQRMKQLSELGPQMEDLERKRELDETNYKYFAATLEKARVDEALDPSKMPNISAVQRPSPPMLETKTRNKIALGLAGGGIALGIALALIKGLVLNRTVGRPLSLETQLHIPLMLSIPYSNARNGHLALPPNGSPANPGALATRPHHSKLAPWEAGHFIRPYCDAIRDRLGLYFELNHLTHKPKLVGIAGFSEDAGASTLAAGLAASLSETNDGKVLLVDVNLGPEDVHQFFKGKPAYSLSAALKPKGTIASAADNLYLATVGSPNAGPAQLGLKKFFDMMPNLKASDFDYIIFDMPQLSQTSPTWGMAAFMDKLLLVVEAEKDNREVIKRGYGKLVAERDNVGVVVNKARSYVPKWLHGDS
ncbi:MAG TPA: Wzz/FepE/Etk N-terminal domain-containing protein [Methylomirabilota bacterium]|nr:Wzz/FepE/Etk N-terminal domain-containing protein [Methylomirabilota bacterium]